MLKIKVHSKLGWDYPPVEVKAGGFRIGRDPANDLVINDSSVSMFHCRIDSLPDGTWEICDLESVNGVYARGAKSAKVAVPPMHVFKIFLGEVELELLDQQPNREETRKVEVPALALAFSPSSLIGAVKWGAIGFIIFLLEKSYANYGKYDDNRYSMVLYDTVVVFLAFIGLCVMCSALCKLTRHEYRFKQIYLIWMFAAGGTLAGDLVLLPIYGYTVDAEIQNAIRGLVKFTFLGGGAAFLLREIFHSLRLRVTIGFVFLVVLGFLLFEPIHNQIAKTYYAKADAVPNLIYPFASWGANANSNTLMNDLVKDKKEIDKERIELLKLR